MHLEYARACLASAVSTPITPRYPTYFQHRHIWAERFLDPQEIWAAHHPIKPFSLPSNKTSEHHSPVNNPSLLPFLRTQPTYYDDKTGLYIFEVWWKANLIWHSGLLRHCWLTFLDLRRHLRLGFKTSSASAFTEPGTKFLPGFLSHNPQKQTHPMMKNTRHTVTFLWVLMNWSRFKDYTTRVLMN